MNGIIVIDKPEGHTSHDVVARIRGAAHERRVGHSGTLDPMATGVLVVFIGRATRAVEFAESDDKRYLAALRLGITTDTQDIGGTILAQREVSVNPARLEQALAAFRGETEQTPPMYSAVKIGGKKLYELARAGVEVERKSRRITIKSMETAGEADGDILLDITCSKGTYIRTLCHDIGEYLGCGGCMAGLRRLRAGRFSIEHAHPLDEILENPEAFLLPVDSLFDTLPAIKVDAAGERKIKNGSPIPANAPDGDYRFYSENGEFLMLGRVKDAAACVIKSFFEV